MDAVVVVQMVEEGVHLAHVVQDVSVPNDTAIAERLAVAAEWAHAVESSR